MVPKHLYKLLQQPNNAILAVNRADNAPHLTPIWYLWDEEAFYFNTTSDRVKTKNIKRDPAISLIVDDADNEQYVVAYGQAQIIEHDDPTFAPLTREIIAKYVKPEEQAEALNWALAPKRIIIKLNVEKIVAQ